MVTVIAMFNITMADIDLSNSEFSLSNLRFTIASADGESGTDTLKRIKTTAQCHDDVTGVFTGIRITACEEYQWKIPMARTTCHVNSCQPGSS